jgi:CRP-like cAMP-binding protein
MKPFIPLKDVRSVLSILTKISMFGGISEKQQREIFRRLETGRFKPGEFIFQKGDEPAHIYIVKSGMIDLLLPDEEEAIHMKQLQVGECFGEASLMSMHQHTASAVALEPSEVIGLSRHALNQLRHEDLELFALLMMNLTRELARRLRDADNTLIRCLHSCRKKDGPF